jgi:hypothetical protein
LYMAMKKKPVGKKEQAIDVSHGGSPGETPAYESVSYEELSQIAMAAAELAERPDEFDEAYKAHLEGDEARFRAVLEEVALLDRCRYICWFFCHKHCVRKTRIFCPERQEAPVDATEMREFAGVFARLVEDQREMHHLIEIFDRDDGEHWQEWIRESGMARFCHQLTHILCVWRCRKVCRRMCPPKPLITRVGSIPVSQIGSTGLGNGPSLPVGQVAPPNLSAGYGDHPFGGSVCLMGIFNMPTAIEYLVEYSSNGPLGPYQPIIVSSVPGYNWNSTPPYIHTVSRSPSGPPDPGWFKISEIPYSDGGNSPAGEKTLLYWPTGSLNGTFYIRLRVRNTSYTLVSSPQIVELDNTGPYPLPRPVISLKLKKPDGTLEELKCGRIKRSDGLILVTIQAYDPHYRGVSVTARGNSGLSVALYDTSSVPLSKTYHGDPGDTGYPSPTEFLWDPWSDPQIKPCCYVVYVEVNDRTIINNSYSGGHYNAGWEAIEIGI